MHRRGQGGPATQPGPPRAPLRPVRVRRPARRRPAAVHAGPPMHQVDAPNPPHPAPVAGCSPPAAVRFARQRVVCGLAQRAGKPHPRAAPALCRAGCCVGCCVGCCIGRCVCRYVCRRVYRFQARASARGHGAAGTGLAQVFLRCSVAPPSRNAVRWRHAPCWRCIASPPRHRRHPSVGLRTPRRTGGPASGLQRWHRFVGLLA